MEDELLLLLPAFYRINSDNLAAASSNVIASVQKELGIRRLDRVFRWLWVTGQPTPPRPLHHHFLMSREIVVTERMDMHLLWADG
jgi:hypothetical protein